jgi:calcineurin-like phosphoesterase family protein
MSEKWFTADTHAWHQNIIRYCSRPWKDARDMTHEMAANINAHVPANGVLYHLGDFSWGNEMWVEGFRSMINCRKIRLVLGNHDKLIRRIPGLQTLFDNVCDIEEVNLLSKRKKIVLCHYAMSTWNASFHGSWHLYGHSHGTLEENPRSLSFDVGVDCWDFNPISLDRVCKRMEGKVNAS